MRKSRSFTVPSRTLHVVEPVIMKRASEAIGNRDGDTLTIANAWETVTIVREHAERANGDVHETTFIIDGKTTRYGNIVLALTAAFEHLAEYARGRCD